MGHKQAKKIRQYFRREAQAAANQAREQAENLIQARIDAVDKHVSDLTKFEAEKIFQERLKLKPKHCPSFLWNFGRGFFYKIS